MTLSSRNLCSLKRCAVVCVSVEFDVKDTLAKALKKQQDLHVRVCQLNYSLSKQFMSTSL